MDILYCDNVHPFALSDDLPTPLTYFFPASPHVSLCVQVLGRHTAAALLRPCHPATVSHSTPPCPLTPTGFLPHPLECSLGLGRCDTDSPI